MPSPSPEPRRPALRATLRLFRPLESWAARWEFATRQLARTMGGRLERMPSPPPRRVLFVCHGNIMRSALAEYLLRRALGRSEPGMVVGSAGVAATPGKPADPRTLRFAADLGLDLGGHAARRFTGEMASDFDLIFALDRKIEAEVCAVAPAHRERVLLLGGLTPLGDWAGRDVPDPYLWSDAETDRVFTSLIAASELLARRLRPDPIGVQ